MGAAASVIVVGIVLLKELRSRSVIPKEPHVNREYEREAYMNSILYRGDQHCVSQIRMRKFVAKMIFICKWIFIK